MSNVMVNVLHEFKPLTNRLRCTMCGATQAAPCQCGVPYQLLRPRVAAEIGLKETPQLSNTAIAHRMGISETTVRTVRSGREKNEREAFWTAEKDAKVMELHKQGKTDKEISEVFGISIGAASGRKHRLMNIRPELESRFLPPIMPDDILTQVTLLASTAKARMFEIDSLSAYVDQMHEDTRQLIAQEVEVVLNLSRDIIRRLVGGTRNIRPPACGTAIKIRKEE